MMHHNTRIIKYKENKPPPKKTFTLSADAPEFVPRAFVPAAPQPQQQQFPQISQQMGMVSLPFPQPQVEYMNHPVILCVNNLVVQLTMKPDRFEPIARQLTTILTWQVKNVCLMKEVVTVIFEQGVGEVNFRYSGARLCEFLSKNVTQQHNGPTFKSLLLQRCQDEHSARQILLQVEPGRLRGFTFFLAELLTQLTTATAQPFDVIRTGVCDLLQTLLKQPSDDNLKCVAQVLKFTGASLDSGEGSEMDVVMCTIKDVAMTAPCSPNTRSLLLSVVELRAANWGRLPSSPGVQDSSTTSNVDVPLGTVYYGPDGVVRVEDYSEDSASDSEDAYGWSPAVEELEGDVAEAFEEFLKLQQ
ncbi:polyadenylate-binding protein-interacting protein 1-like isoform X2 [Oratosquilla oratoria]|uniref:polyadenylate-binding protein-interacting protein 1-like isoform X2 n=1 Tax=Oratosquilla oratoria TaxID=337810 RepID=UPI003F767335